MPSKNNFEFINIKAVHDKDLVGLLEELKILENFKNHEVVCELCEKTLNPEDIGALYFENNQIKICCNVFECVSSLANK